MEKMFPPDAPDSDLVYRKRLLTVGVEAGVLPVSDRINQELHRITVEMHHNLLEYVAALSTHVYSSILMLEDLAAVVPEEKREMFYRTLANNYAVHEKVKPAVDAYMEVKRKQIEGGK